ncbi:siderophore ABC transporter substrate-binding protein [Alkalihalobacillus hwajinpoensis]|uniref:siderophore ABC transporter substrate-binding protein n=1 Tax=Guptibacillus hwajinpoensis TaxID=208199 RepID=UPI00188471C2|nr:siderophore ABC transporter substrate-binding protein [Pseudalkalibacillus hwajinpoensis]MBF0707463.1 siderophore ABC transporter substrate-binding protein [Pseudalkalibacillus hwajinpoensis]
MRKWILVLALSALALIVSACGTNNSEATEVNAEAKGSSETEEVTVKHDLGETTVQKNPENVVVFDFGTLDTLDKLGVEVAGVPQANIPSYLSKYEADTYENAGGLKEPDFEQIAEMNPGLIIISGRQSDAYEELSKIAPTIYMGVDTTDYIPSFKKNVTTLGEIFGKEAEAEEELAKIDEEISSVQDLTSSLDEKGLITLVTGGKVSAYGAGSRFGLIHDVLGLPEADANLEASTHGQSISFEYIAEKNPGYLFVVDRDAVVDGGETSAKEVIENELVKNTDAYKNDHIVYLDPNYWYLSGGGLESVTEMVSEIKKGIE